MLQPVAQAPLCVPVGVNGRIIGDHQGRNMELVRFKELIHLMFHIFPGDPVIAHKGIGEYQQLSFVGRVGQALGITGHGCIKHHFSGHASFVSKGFPFKSGSVLQNQCNGFELHGFQLLLIDSIFNRLLIMLSACSGVTRLATIFFSWSRTNNCG